MSEDLHEPGVAVHASFGDHASLLARLIPESWRWAHRLYANFNGYFWLPCPLCGKPSGGHEWRDIDGKPSYIPAPADPADPPGTRTFKGICPSCTRAGLGVPISPPAPS